MIHKTRDLSIDQKIVLEGLLGRPMTEDGAISIRAIDSPQAPAWLQTSWESASRDGVDRLSPMEIDSEIEAVRRTRRGASQHQ